MSGPQHTPGPWHLATNKHPTTDGRPWGAVEAKRHPAGGAGTPPVGIRDITWQGETGRANARLIASAPDMAAALQQVIDWHEVGEQKVGAWIDVLHSIRAALRKATGAAP